MAWTTPKTWSDGSSLTAAELNEQVRDNEQWLKDLLTLYNMTSSTTAKSIKPALAGTRLYRGSDMNISDSTTTNVTFGSEKFDTANGASSTYHSTSVNTERITIPSGLDGYYMIGTNLAWATNTTGIRRLWVNHSTDGVIGADSTSGISTSATKMSVSCLWYCAGGDYLYVSVWQNSTITLAIDGTTDPYLPCFWAYRVGI